MAGLTVGEKVSANDLYYGLILPSGGDAAVGLASVTTDQEDFSYFTDLMNLEVAMMGLKNTHYTNPVSYTHLDVYKRQEIFLTVH